MRKYSIAKGRESRILYIDVLRIVAIFFVIILHVSEKNWLSTSINSYDWRVMNFFDSISRWCVPVLVMISGSLFLNREISISILYKKYILRLMISFAIWSFAYSLVYNVIVNHNFEAFVTSFIKGHYHLWYIYMIISLYMITPFLKKIIADNKLIKYFVALSVIFAMIIPEIIGIITFFSEYGKWAESVINQTYLKLVLGFTVYYIMGYYLHNMAISQKATMMICLLGLIGFISTAVFTLLISERLLAPIGLFYGFQTINVFLEAVSVYILIKKIIDKVQFGEKSIKRIITLSKYSFGAYLVHAFILSLIEYFVNLYNLTFNPILSIPCISILVFIVSFGVSAILNKLPVVKNLLV